MQAVILTAGRGDRLRPVTDLVPKSLIPFWGKPFLAYVLDSLVGLVDEVVVVVAADEYVQRAFGDNWRGLPLRYVIQPHPGGTGDALLHARKILDERFLVLLGDTLAPRDTLKAVLERQGDAVLTLIEVDDPCNHSGVGIHNGLVVDNLWVDNSNLVDAGVTLLPRHICDYLQQLPPRGRELRILQGVAALLEDGFEVRAVKMPGPWLQYGDHEGVAGVCRVMNQLRPYIQGVDLDRPASIDIANHDCKISNSVVFGPGKLYGCTIRDSLIYCENSVEERTADGQIAVW